MKLMLSFLAVLTAASGLAELSAADKPNVVFFIAADVSQGDFRCYGHPVIWTPNLDALARSESTLYLYYPSSPGGFVKLGQGGTCPSRVGRAHCACS